MTRIPKAAPEYFQVEPETAEPRPIALTPASPSEEESEQTLFDVLGELGGVDDAKVNIYRAGGIKGSRGGEYVDSLHPSEFSLQWLRDTYGGGEYRIHIRSAGRMYGNRLVKIAEPLKKETALPAQNNAGIEALAETMNQGFRQLGEMMMRMAEMSRAPAIDPMAAQQAALQNMLTMKQILAPAVTAPPTDPMLMFMKGIEIAASLKGGDSVGDREPGGSDILMKALETFGAPIAAAVASAQNQPEIVQPAQQYLPQQIQAPVQAQVNPQNNQGNNMFGLKQYASMLVGIAKENRDPYTYAGLVVDSAPREEIEKIVNDPSPINRLAVLDKRLADPALNLWLTEFIGIIREMLTESSESATVAEQPLQTWEANAIIGTAAGFFPTGEQADTDNGNA